MTCFYFQYQWKTSMVGEAEYVLRNDLCSDERLAILFADLRPLNPVADLQGRSHGFTKMERLINRLKFVW